MHFEYTTNRLSIRTLFESDAQAVLDFYKQGSNIFIPIEPPKPQGFYTHQYQRILLTAEHNAFLDGTSFRYFVFLTNHPDTIIGTVSFSNIIKGAYHSCILGYKFLPEYKGNGYATESVSRMITALFEENHMHRIEAFTLPHNLPSVSLLLRLGFRFESIAHSIIKLESGYTDHNRYILINPQH